MKRRADMAYILHALIGSADVLRKHTFKFGTSRLVTLPQGMGMIPLTDDLNDEIGGDDIGFSKLSSATVGWAKDISIDAPIAYVEAEFFGGIGGQVAIVWSGGSKVLGPIYSEHPINQALNFLGVEAGNAHDEFDALGLGKHRNTQAWIVPHSDIHPVIRKHSLLPFERLRVIQDLSELELASIRSAIIFVFAAWSGPSVQALPRVTRLLSTLDLGSLAIIILDNDCMTPDEMVCHFGRVLHGAGEVIWIRNGQITAELSAFQPESEVLILAHTRNLLSQSS